MPAPAEPASSLNVACSSLAAVLWRERDKLDHLLYALHCQQFVLTNGAVRWITATDVQVNEALNELGDCELHRAIETNRLTELMGLPADSVLDDIASRCESPWDTLFAEHRDGLKETLAEISAVTAHNRRLLRVGAEIVRDTLDRVSTVPARHNGRTDTLALLFDRQI